jgi:hypothetical protein
MERVGILELFTKCVQIYAPRWRGLRIGAQYLVGKHQHVIKVHGVAGAPAVLKNGGRTGALFLPEILVGLSSG